MAARSPSSVCVGGMRMSTIATSGRQRSTSCEQLLRVRGQPSDLEAGLVEQAREPLAQQQRVVGDDYPHGISARSVVPRPGRARHGQLPAERLDAVGQPAQTGAAVGLRTADAVVGTSTTSVAVARDVDPDSRSRCECLTAFVNASLTTK